MVRWARWLASAGSGSETTSTCQPSAASATPAWCNAAPQLRVASRPSGSVTPNCRLGSRYRSRPASPTFQRHGWLLWIDGAHPAVTAAQASASVTVYADGCPPWVAKILDMVGSLPLVSTLRPAPGGAAGPHDPFPPGPWNTAVNGWRGSGLARSAGRPLSPGGPSAVRE